MGDLRKVGDLSDQQIQGLCETLGKEKGFLGTEGLKPIVIKVLGKSEITEAVVRVLWNVEPDDLSSVLRHLQSDIKEKDQFEALKTRLIQLVKACPALERYRKAQRLAGATGYQLEDVQIICDLRPIFDEKREKIEGMFPTTILRVVSEGVDGLSVVNEVYLTVSQVHELAEKANSAKKKLDILKHHIQEVKPEGLPDLPSTRIPNGDK